jgi:hypothetical protein
MTVNPKSNGACYSILQGLDPSTSKCEILGPEKIIKVTDFIDSSITFPHEVSFLVDGITNPPSEKETGKIKLYSKAGSGNTVDELKQFISLSPKATKMSIGEILPSNFKTGEHSEYEISMDTINPILQNSSVEVIFSNSYELGSSI